MLVVWIAFPLGGVILLVWLATRPKVDAAPPMAPSAPAQPIAPVHYDRQKWAELVQSDSDVGLSAAQPGDGPAVLGRDHHVHHHHLHARGERGRR